MAENHVVLHLLHIFVIGGLFLYVSLYPSNISNAMFSFLFYLGVFIIIYHMYKIHKYFLLGKSYKINLFHIYLVAPLLIYIGHYKPPSNDFVYTLLLMTTFAVIGIHTFYLFT